MTELEMASYLDRALSADERDRIENHLAECKECRQRVSGAQELVARLRRPRSGWLALGAVAAAAAMLFIMRPSRAPESSSLERAAVSPRTNNLVAYQPVDNAALNVRRFIWSSAPGTISYRLTIGSADGATIWSHSGTDTVAILPERIELPSGIAYTWVVDAITSDGSTRSTGMRTFLAK